MGAVWLNENNVSFCISFGLDMVGKIDLLNTSCLTRIFVKQQDVMLPDIPR